MKFEYEVLLTCHDDVERLSTSLNELSCDVNVQRGNRMVDGKSVLGMLLMNGRKVKISIITSDMLEAALFKELCSDYIVEQ